MPKEKSSLKRKKSTSQKTAVGKKPSKKQALAPRQKRSCINVVFLLDRSGSMISCVDAVTSGVGEYVTGLVAQEDNIKFTLAEFYTGSDSKPVLNIRYPNVKPSAVNLPFTFDPNGNTPLYDAVGTMITGVEKQNIKGAQVIFVIFTDGEENASTAWKRDSIRDLITRKQNDGWTFVYMGAGINTWADAAALSIKAGNIGHYAPTQAGTLAAFASLANSTAMYVNKSGQATASFFADANEVQEQGDVVLSNKKSKSAKSIV